MKESASSLAMLRDHSPSQQVYARALRALVSSDVPFVVGGAFALRQYCYVDRNTKDLDVFVKPDDLERALEALQRAGFATDVPYPHWLGKASDGDDFVDVIFNSGNGLTPVDDEWFEHAEKTVLLGSEVLVCPPEEMIWSKAFVMERERFDGADVMHLLRARASQLDWDRLLRRFGDHGAVLLAHLLLFRFVYPGHAHTVPERVTDELMRVAKTGGAPSAPPRLCRGTLLSREQYLADLASGYRDGRLPPSGTMSPEAIAIWTDAIHTGH